MSSGVKVRENRKKAKKKKYLVQGYKGSLFEYDIKDYDGYSDDPEDLIDD